MITVYSFFACLALFHRILLRSPITFFFSLAFFIKVIFPFYYFSRNSDISTFSDLHVAASFVIIFLISTSNRKWLIDNVGEKTFTDIRLNKYLIYGAIVLLPVAWLGFLFPAIFENQTPPMLIALGGDHVKAHNVRVFITKSSDVGLIIDVVGKVIFPILLLALSISFRQQNTKEKIITFLLVFGTMVVSFAYFQKAFPFNLLLVFVIGLSLSGFMSIRRWIAFSVLCAVLLLLVSRLYGPDFSIGVLKFRDLLFRRLGKTPVIVYTAYMNYAEAFGPVFLKYSFILQKSPENPALPMEIYQFMKYGDSPTGWANGLFVGDLFVNFGTAGVAVGSAVIGFVLRTANRFMYAAQHNISFVVGTLGILMFSLSLPGNSFFAFSIFFYMGLFAISYALNPYLGSGSPKS